MNGPLNHQIPVHKKPEPPLNEMPVCIEIQVQVHDLSRFLLILSTLTFDFPGYIFIDLGINKGAAEH
jgi:hypothetical protein